MRRTVYNMPITADLLFLLWSPFLEVRPSHDEIEAPNE